MKYYLINFLVFNNQQIVEDNTMAVAISMDVYDCTHAFKQQIIRQRLVATDSRDIVIKTYKQINEDIFQLIHPFVKENKLPEAASSQSSQLSYRFNPATYSV